MRKLILAGAAVLTLAMAMPQVSAAQIATSADQGATPEKIALVKRYFAAMHFQTMMSGMMHQMGPALMQAARKQHPEISDAQSQAVSDAMAGAMDDFIPKMTDAMIPVYAETFTTDELTQLDAFYESPVGQSILSKTPTAMQKMMPAMMQLMPDLQADMMTRMCAKIDCKAKKAS